VNRLLSLRTVEFFRGPNSSGRAGYHRKVKSLMAVFSEQT